MRVLWEGMHFDRSRSLTVISYAETMTSLRADTGVVFQASASGDPSVSRLRSLRSRDYTVARDEQ
jgi:hypothetical protein